MADLMDRYIYDVVRRLPEKDRDEVSRELSSNIWDMLPEGAGENEIKGVLYELGSPASLAEQYRQNPRYLISPALYEDYVRILKIVVPIVGVVLLVIGLITGVTETVEAGETGSALIGPIISSAISSGISGVFQAFVWTTIGFAIAERAGAGSLSKQREWRIDELPEIIPDKKNEISLADSIAEVVLTAVFSVVAVLLCLRVIPVAYVLKLGDVTVQRLFEDSFLVACIPVIVIMALATVVVCIIKIIKRRWSPLVCIAAIAGNIVSIILALYLYMRPAVFSAEFIQFVQTQEWGQNLIFRSIGEAPGNPIILIIAAIIIVCSVADSCVAVYKTRQVK